MLLCQHIPTGVPAQDIKDACCLCKDCGGVCTQFAITWVSGPQTKITYVNCAGTPTTDTLGVNTSISICCFQGTTYTVVNSGTTVSHTVTLCAC